MGLPDDAIPCVQARQIDLLRQFLNRAGADRGNRVKWVEILCRRGGRGDTVSVYPHHQGIGEPDDGQSNQPTGRNACRDGAVSLCIGKRNTAEVVGKVGVHRFRTAQIHQLCRLNHRLLGIAPRDGTRKDQLRRPALSPAEKGRRLRFNRRADKNIRINNEVDEDFRQTSSRA